MVGQNLFKVSGYLFINAGALFLFYWVVTTIGGFKAGGPSIIPTFEEMGAAHGMLLLRLAIISLGSFIFALGLVLYGAIFVKLPDVINLEETVEEQNLEKKLNKLQIVVWKILQHMRERHRVEQKVQQ